ncbi:MAG: hypothetical protein NZ927_06005 [Candidatus Calescibacterium sp.]|nr:hypothetical protein [Candidatus Calescibacterium sp.]MCX7734914.1 hypothetical protein [bacterium]
MNVNFVVPVCCYKNEILFQQTQNRQDFSYFFVLDGVESSVFSDVRSLHNVNFIPFAKRSGQYHAIYQGLKFLMSYKFGSSGKDELVVICDYDMLPSITQNIEYIVNLVSLQDKIVIGLNRNKIRSNLRHFCSEFFYTLISLFLRIFLELKGIHTGNILSSIRYITSFSAFHYKYLRYVLNCSNFFSIYLFALLLLDFDRKNKSFGNKIFFYDLYVGREKISKSSYNFISLLQLSFYVFKDVINFIKEIYAFDDLL